MWGGEGRRGGNERGEGGAIELCVLCVGCGQVARFPPFVFVEK